MSIKLFLDLSDSVWFRCFFLFGDSLIFFLWIALEIVWFLVIIYKNYNFHRTPTAYKVFTFFQFHSKRFVSIHAYPNKTVICKFSCVQTSIYSQLDCILFVYLLVYWCNVFSWYAYQNVHRTKGERDVIKVNNLEPCRVIVSSGHL